MSARLGIVVILALFAGLYWAAGTAYSDVYSGDDFLCKTPDGAYYDSAAPCDYNFDYDSPGLGSFGFDIGSGRRHSDRDRDRDWDKGYGPGAFGQDEQNRMNRMEK